MLGTLFQFVRQAVYSFLRLKPVNAIGRSLLSRISSPWLYQGRYVFPVRGDFKVRYQDGKDFVMSSNGCDTIASRVFFGGALGFEESTSCVLSRYFKEGGTFFDIGANSGIYSLMAATFPQTTQVHAFEPMSNAFQILQTNVEKNHFKNVTVNKLALGDRNGQLELAVPVGITLPTGSSAKGSSKFGLTGEFRSEIIPLTTLDDYIVQNNIQRVDLIKIDTETTEPAVIRGALKTIAKFRPKIVCEIIREQAAREIEALLREVDYKYYHLTSEGPVDLTSLRADLKNMNFLFIPREITLSPRENLLNG